jgi:geranylgeranyl transferase type-2 subunit beta
MTIPYLTRLILRIANGLEGLSPERRNKHVDFLRSMQQADGGFSGRQGGSDLYYTSFALRGLAVLGALDDAIAHQAASFIRQRLQTHVPLIDLISLLFSAQMLETTTGIDPLAESDSQWPVHLTTMFAQLRRSDGGYAKTIEGGAGSTYQTFLTVLIHQQLAQPLPDPEGIGDFVRSQHREDGGFVEVRAMRRSGTNPTAAAVGTLQVIPSWTNQNETGVQLTETVASFLHSMQLDSGGFRANTRIPMADLLSTYTGLQALSDLNCLENATTDKAKLYIGSLEQPQGGWLAAEWDDTIDVEYTFYGLAAAGTVVQ